MILPILLVAVAVVALISFGGGGRTANRTIWLVVGIFLLVGLVLVVAGAD